MAALVVFLCVLILIGSLIFVALTDAFRRDERDHRGPQRPEADR